MDKITWKLIVLILTGVILYSGYICIRGFREDESDLNGKDTTKEEYIYKEELLNMGYSLDIVNKIKSKINENDVKTYLLNKKYDNLNEYLEISYFDVKNIERYENYIINNNISLDLVIMYVEVNLDKEFYSDINEVNDYDSNKVLINKYYKLPSEYEATDLEALSNEYSYKNERVKKGIISDLKAMIDSAKKEGLKLNVVSGYRTESYQDTLFNNSVRKNGLKHALLYSAKKGHSEHQTGYAVDFNITELSFANSNEYKWLEDNAYKYGFIERYPENKENITGYNYEPWHYRYVGVIDATKIYKEDITFEEYCVKYLK